MGLCEPPLGEVTVLLGELRGACSVLIFSRRLEERCTPTGCELPLVERCRSDLPDVGAEAVLCLLSLPAEGAKREWLAGEVGEVGVEPPEYSPESVRDWTCASRWLPMRLSGTPSDLDGEMRMLLERVILESVGLLTVLVLDRESMLPLMLDGRARESLASESVLSLKLLPTLSRTLAERVSLLLLGKVLEE